MGAGILFLINKLKNKKKALENFKIINIDLSIDFKKSKKNWFYKLFYTLKAEIQNNESEAINLKGLNIDLYINKIKVGQLIKTSNIFIPAKSSKIIQVDATILSINVINLILDFLKNNESIILTAKGYLTTNYGNIEVNKTKEINL